MVKKKLPIEYNGNLPIGVVSDDPLTFLLYDKLFDDFLIATDNKQQWLTDLSLSNVSLNVGNKFGQSAQRMLHSKKFADLVKTNPKRKFVLYSPLDPPYKVNPLTYLMNSPTIAHAYENKRYFRDEFSDLIRMPEYEIRYIDQLDKAAAYKELKDEYGEFVMQDEESSGSKGTYIIKDHDTYVDAVRSLKKFSHGRSVVVSKFVEGITASVQVCITKYGIFSGGVQRQLVNSKYLCNTKLEGATKWCGGELGDNFSDIVQHQAHEMATIVGSELASHGYKGVFGIDLILTPTNEVYAIEINARLTGYTHLVSDMQLKQGKIPFLLLHALELGNIKYEVTDLDALPSIGRYSKPVSYMIVNNLLSEDFVLSKYIRPGIYRLKGETLEFEKEAYSIDQLKGEDTMLIFSRYHTGESISSGKRILKITKLGKTMSKSDLNIKTQKLIEIVKETFDLPR
jgi:hypothetical protein